MRKINLFLILLCVSGCSLADLRGDLVWDEKIPDYKSEKAEAVLKVVRRKNKSEILLSATTLSVNLTDTWTSNLIRRLTPIQQLKQALRFDFVIPRNYVSMTYLDGIGRGQTLGIDEKGSYRDIKNVKTYKRFKDIELYIPHIRNYFLWPHVLIDYPVKAFVGETILNHKLYNKIFVTRGNIIPNKKEDQYILWVNAKTQQVDYIEFTMRQVMGSLQGAVVYGDYKNVDGVEMPYSITLVNDIYEEEFSHQLIVGSMEIKR